MQNNNDNYSGKYYHAVVTSTTLSAFFWVDLFFIFLI